MTGSQPTQFNSSFVHSLRHLFPALHREFQDQQVVYFDGPAGTQVPQTVIDAIGRYLSQCNANHHGTFLTSRESDQWLDEVHRGVADLLGTADADEVVFGANMTTLTLHLSRSLAKTWQPGDNIIVTQLDHDANVRPWVLAAEDAGVTVHRVPVRLHDCTLNLDDLAEHLNARTRLVAVGAASNSVGTVNPIEDIVRQAHAVGALVFVDAVHYAPHAAIDVRRWDCDFLACSAYKFFGPHIGVLWGRRQLLESLQPYKLKPAPDALPGRWMSGTQNHECLVGVLAAVDYLADLGRQLDPHGDSRRQALLTAFESIRQYESQLCQQLIAGIQALPQFEIKGITSAERAHERLPTISILHRQQPAAQVTRHLDQRGIFAWHGNYYAWELSHALQVEPDGMTRLGIAHYNTAEEVERVLAALAEL